MSTPLGWAQLRHNPLRLAVALAGIGESRERLSGQDVVLFDANSRPEFGPVSKDFDSAKPLATEINDRAVNVVGLFEMGTSFGIDGSVVTSEDNWLRLFPARSRND